jgi:hypothetical protein
MLTPDTQDRIPRVTRPPCFRCPKVPAETVAARQKTGERVTPADAIEPEPRHWRIVEHDLECRAVNRWPNHETIRRYARIVGDYVQAARDRPLNSLLTSMAVLLRQLQR